MLRLLPAHGTWQALVLTCRTVTMQVANPVVVPRPEPLQLIRSALQNAADLFDDAVMPQERVRNLLKWAAALAEPEVDAVACCMQASITAMGLTSCAPVLQGDWRDCALMAGSTAAFVFLSMQIFRVYM